MGLWGPQVWSRQTKLALHDLRQGGRIAHLGAKRTPQAWHLKTKFIYYPPDVIDLSAPSALGEAMCAMCSDVRGMLADSTDELELKL